MIYDLIIVGMGPAGVSAAIYAKRAGLNILCLDKSMIGGYLNYIDRIENYPGLYGVSGTDFAFKLYDTINELGIEFKNKSVINIISSKLKKVITEKEEYLARNVIIATGRAPRELGLKMEHELLGRGISHCAVCDGAFYKGCDVALVGGGASALQEALYLSNICRKVYLIHRKENFSVTGQVVNEINKRDNIIKVMNRKVSEFIKDSDKLSGILLDNGEKIDVSGLFLYIGFVPVTDFVSELSITDDDGYILVDDNYETSEKGIYAIGDIIDKDVYQISTAVSDGAIVVTKMVDKMMSK